MAELRRLVWCDECRTSYHPSLTLCPTCSEPPRRLMPIPEAVVGKAKKRQRSGSSVRRAQRLFDRDGRRCLKCGRTERQLMDAGLPPHRRLTVDHVIPRAIGGSNRQSNLQTLCADCNEAKGDSHADYRDGPFATGATRA